MKTSATKPDRSPTGRLPERHFDARGLNCPLPILKTRLILNRMRSGETLLVESTDPHSLVDFQAYCARTTHELLHFEERPRGNWRFLLRCHTPTRSPRQANTRMTTTTQGSVTHHKTGN